MRLSDFQDAIVRTLDGNKIGRVHEVHCDGGRIIAIMCGPKSLIERLTARQEGRRISWECVKRVEHRRITVALDDRKPSGSRTPRRTPRTSARRSRR
jgi:sporulation protein YlmC with PRC-barrel domain